MNKFSSFLIKNKYPILLIVVFLSHSLANLIWSQKNYVPVFDAASNLYISFSYYTALINHNFNKFSSITYKNPPLFLLSPIPFYIIFGMYPKTSILANLFFLVVLLFSVYKIGSKISNKKVGLFSMLSVSLFPVIYWYSRLFYVDFALTAMVALSTYLLILTNYFEDRKYSILFGISLGMTALIKYSFIVFLFPPIIFVLAKSNILKRKYTMINFLIFLILSILIASFWYTPKNISELISRYFGEKLYFLGDNGENARSFLDPFTYFWYISLMPEQMNLLYFGLFLAAVVFIIFNSTRKKTEIIMLIISVFFSYCIFTVIPTKDLRFTMPMLPDIAILIGWFLFNLNKKDRNFIIILVIFIALFQFVYEFDNPGISKLNPVIAGFKINEKEVIKMINLIMNESSNNKSVTYESFNIILDAVPMYYSFMNHTELIPLDLQFKKGSIYSSLIKADYLLVDENIGGFPNSNQYKEVLEMLNNNSKELKHFKFIGSFKIMNNSTMKVYKNCLQN